VRRARWALQGLPPALAGDLFLTDLGAGALRALRPQGPRPALGPGVLTRAPCTGGRWCQA